MDARIPCALLAALASLTGTASAADPPPWLGLVANNQFPRNNVSTFDPVARAFGQNVNVSGDTTWVLPSPDATKAYATTLYTSNTFQVLDLATKQSVRTLALGGDSPFEGAISPDGTLAYVDASTSRILRFDLTKDPPAQLDPIVISGTPNHPAFEPDGETAWVCRGSDVIPIDVGSAAAGTAIPVGGCNAIAASPDGSRMWATDMAGKKVTVIDTATRATTPIPVAAGHPRELAPSPDGRRMYVSLHDEHALTWIDTATLAVAPALDVGGVRALSVAVTPDGRTVFVTEGTFNGTGQGTQIRPVDVSKDPPEPLPPITGFTDPVWAAITPDQAPTANFTVTAAGAGSPTAFDAAGSAPGTTPVASYDWDFGDGAKQTTTNPAVTHTYAKDGTFAARLTVTSAAGTAVADVYNGRSTVRNGRPEATTARSVVIAAGPRPVAELSAASLDFGTIAVGREASRTLELRNTGDAPLTVAGTTLTGADYRLVSDACGGKAIDPGAACSVAIALRPSGGGARPGSVAFADDASGSPHTVLLSGAGTTIGALTGRVIDAGGAPVAARLTSCRPGPADCRQTSTGADGRFRFDGLEPGPRWIETATSSELIALTVSADVVPGESDVGAIVARRPEPPPRGFTFTGVGGTSGGTPVLYWNGPSSFEAPVPIVGQGDPGEIDQVSVLGGLTIPGSPSSKHAAALLHVRYGADGRPAAIVALSEQTAATLGDDSAPGARSAQKTTIGGIFGLGGLTGEVTRTGGSSWDFAFEGGTYKINHSPVDGYKVEPGPYNCDPKKDEKAKKIAETLNGFLFGGTPQALLPTEGDVLKVLRDSADTIKAIPTGGSPRRRQAGTVVFGGGQPIPTGPQARLVLLVDGVPLRMGASGSGGGEYSLRDKDGKPRELTARYELPSLDRGLHGWARMGQEVQQFVVRAGGSGGGGPAARPAQDQCQRDEDPADKRQGSNRSDKRTENDGYIDPSGFVRTTTGAPVVGAKVVLSRSDLETGPFSAVPDGSTIMSPKNRRNPDRTDAAGHFGWDVIAGFYRVTAERAGCRAATGGGRAAITEVLPVPPPVFDLDLRLRCPDKRRRAAVLAAALGDPRSRALRRVVLGALVRGRGRGRERPAGVVEFRDGRRALGAAVVDRRGVALLPVTVRGRSHAFRARYRGDGRFKPAASRTARIRRR